MKQCMLGRSWKWNQWDRPSTTTVELDLTSTSRHGSRNLQETGVTSECPAENHRPTWHDGVSEAVSASWFSSWDSAWLSKDASALQRCLHVLGGNQWQLQTTNYTPKNVSIHTRSENTTNTAINSFDFIPASAASLQTYFTSDTRPNGRRYIIPGTNAASVFGDPGGAAASWLFTAPSADSLYHIFMRGGSVLRPWLPWKLPSGERAGWTPLVSPQQSKQFTAAFRTCTYSVGPGRRIRVQNPEHWQTVVFTQMGKYMAK